MRVALVHDWLNQLGGAEDVLQALIALFPGAPIYTSMFWRAKMPAAFHACEIHTTWMDHLPGIYRHHPVYIALYPLAFSRMDLSRYDVVVSNKSGFCHGVRTGAACHICYCLTPTRYVWDFEGYTARESVAPALKAALRPLIGILRRWDYQAAQRVTHFVAISEEVRRRIRRFYRRDATVIYPPVDTLRFRAVHRTANGRPDTPLANALPRGYYLIVSRLIPYRRIDLAIEAFNKLRLPLVIAGEGRDRSRLEALAGPTITFLGRVPNEVLPQLMANCRAYVLPGEEDFGIAPVQAQAAGRPVIAYAGGGALETVIAGKTGTFFREPSPQALADAVADFDPDAIDPEQCRLNAARFSRQVFEEKFRRFLDTVLTNGKLPTPS